MNNNTKQNSAGSYQQGFKDGKRDMTFTIFFSMYFVIILGLAVVSMIKDIQVLGIMSVILGIAIMVVPMILGAYQDYCQSSNDDKKIIKKITFVLLSGLILSILLVLS